MRVLVDVVSERVWMRERECVCVISLLAPIPPLPPQPLAQRVGAARGVWALPRFYCSLC